MAHRLEPKEGDALLDPQIVVERLKQEFEYVSVDAQQGQKFAEGMLTKLIDIGAPEVIIELARRMVSQALWVTVADDEVSDGWLSFLVTTEEGPFVSYADGHEEKRLKRLTRRCAKALNYRVEEV